MQVIDVVVFVLIGICGITDLRTGKIYNKVTYPAILLGLSWNVWMPDALGWWSRIEGFALAAVLMGALTLMGGMGGGDAKLLAAIGALKGYPFILDVLFYSFLVGGVIALAIAIWQRRFLRILGNVWRMLLAILIYRSKPETAEDETGSYKIPFGLAICLGTLWAQLLELLRG